MNDPLQVVRLKRELEAATEFTRTYAARIMNDTVQADRSAAKALGVAIDDVRLAWEALQDLLKATS